MQWEKIPGNGGQFALLTQKVTDIQVVTYPKKKKEGEKEKIKGKIKESNPIHIYLRNTDLNNFHLEKHIQTR